MLLPADRGPAGLPGDQRPGAVGADAGERRLHTLGAVLKAA